MYSCEWYIHKKSLKYYTYKDINLTVCIHYKLDKCIYGHDIQINDTWNWMNY